MLNKKGNPNILTAREKGSMGRLVVLVAMTFLILFTICSAYAILMQPSNPASWSMLAFFAVALFIFIAHEENAFPDLPQNKLLPAIVMWLFLWIFVAFLVSFLFTMNIGHLGIAILFGLIVFVAGAYTVTNEAQWGNLKAKTGGRVKARLRRSAGKLSKNKPAKRKRSNKKKEKKWKMGGW